MSPGHAVVAYRVRTEARKETTMVYWIVVIIVVLIILGILFGRRR